MVMLKIYIFISLLWFILFTYVITPDQVSPSQLTLPSINAKVEIPTDPSRNTSPKYLSTSTGNIVKFIITGIPFEHQKVSLCVSPKYRHVYY